MTSPTTMTKPMFVNGVDVAAMNATIEAVKATPAIAAFEFRATNTWMGCDRNRTTIGAFTGAMAEQRTDVKPFVFDNGEHQVLLGSDQAPNPVEWLLHALIGCMTTTTAYHAAARGIQVRAISSQISGDLDLQGFLGLSDKVRKGYSAIRVRMMIDADATPETMKAITAMSPVLDVVSRSVPVDVQVAIA